MSAVNIEGVYVKNPTMVWTQLKNTRESVLDRKDRWNSGGWFSGGGDGVPESMKTPWTMCLANALRYVVRGHVGKPAEYSRDINERDTAEKIVLVAINLTHKPQDGGKYQDIPAFNDEQGRRFEEVMAVIDKAIELVQPFAKHDTTVFAADVLTDEEKKDMAAAVRKAESDVWAEYFGSWLNRHEERGWGTFWDELLECDENDADCRERALAL